MDFFSLSVSPAVLYLVSINATTFFFFVADKMLAVGKARRVRERTLFLLALVGGSPAAFLAMLLVRHKTRKSSFQGVMALILIVQIGIFFWFTQQ